MCREYRDTCFDIVLHFFEHHTTPTFAALDCIGCHTSHLFRCKSSILRVDHLI